MREEAQASEFDHDTAVVPSGEGRWRAEVSARWNVGNAPNGGYLVTLVLAAVREALPQPDPLAVSTHFLSRTRPGLAEIEVQTERSGGISTASARLIQEGEPRVLVTATYGDLGSFDGPTVVAAEPPDLPPPDSCARSQHAVGLPEIANRFDLRLDPATAGFVVGRPSGVAEIRGWARFADGRDPDTASLPLFADALPPPVMNVTDVAWVPTLELTVHVRGRPAPGWLRCAFRTRFLVDGYLEEDGEIWDSETRLVALSRQLARIHR
jgi:acyl-CoA thioesterase